MNYLLKSIFIDDIEGKSFDVLVYNGPNRFHSNKILSFCLNYSKSFYVVRYYDFFRRTSTVKSNVSTFYDHYSLRKDNIFIRKKENIKSLHDLFKLFINADLRDIILFSNKSIIVSRLDIYGKFSELVVGMFKVNGFSKHFKIGFVRFDRFVDSFLDLISAEFKIKIFINKTNGNIILVYNKKKYFSKINLISYYNLSLSGVSFNDYESVFDGIDEFFEDMFLFLKDRVGIDISKNEHISNLLKGSFI